MKLKFFALALTLLFTQGLQAKTVKELTERYIRYVGEIGAKPLAEITEKNFPPIWTKNCKKTSNGTVMYDDGGFLAQLKAGREAVGSWKPFDVKETIYNDEARTAFIRFNITAGKLTAHVAKILIFDEQGMIREIVEMSKRHMAA